MGAEAKLYLQEHSIPQLFEGLMTGLIYNRPPDPLDFLEKAIQSVKEHPESELAWDMFIEKGITSAERRDIASKRAVRTRNGVTRENKTSESEKRVRKSRSGSNQDEQPSREPTRDKSVSSREKTRESSASMVLHRSPSVIKAAEVAQIPNVPIILFMGGPGGGKTRHAAKVYAALEEKGLVHICMPDVIRQALHKYKDKYAEWKEANENYIRGELIPNHLALALLRAEMGRHKDAAAFFLEGFPREARQVEDFERQIKSVNMALIIDYDEKTLRNHMERRGLGMELIDQKIKEFKQKTLPSAKYFDDQKLLHLIPGEKDDQAIFERMKSLVVRAMDSGVPVYNQNSPTPPSQNGPPPQPTPPTPLPAVASVPTTSTSERAQTAEPEKESNQKPATPVELPPISSSKPPTPNRPRSNTSAKGSASSQSRTTPSQPEPVADRPKTVEKPATATSEKTPSRGSVVSEGSSTGKVSRLSTTKEEEEIKEEEVKQEAAPEVATEPAAPIVEEPTKPETPLSASSEPKSTPEVVVAPPSAKPTSSESRSQTADTVPRGLPNNAPVVLIVGAPGAQKQEISRRVVEKYDGFVLLSMGDLLRKKVSGEKNDELWQRVGRKMDKGEPVPLKLCRQLLYPEMHKIGQTSWGYIIEGYPRSQSQVNDMENTIERIDLVILIDCTEQYCEETIKKRLEAKTAERADDDPEVFKSRLATFKQNTLPMLKYLDDKGKLKVVDGDSDPETVFKEVTQAIDSSLFIEEDDGSGHSLEESKKGSLND